MSYTTTITFSEEKLNNEPDLIQVILIFTHDLAGSNRSWNAEDYGLRITNYGELEIKYELEDAFMAPGIYELAIGDSNGILDNLFFGTDAIALATDKRATITLKINGVIKYQGTILEDSIIFDEALYNFNLKFSPQTEILNNTMVFNDAGSHTFYIASFTDLPQLNSVYSNNSSHFQVLRTMQVGSTGRFVTNRISGTNEPLSADYLTKVSGNGDSSYPYNRWWYGNGFNQFDLESTSKYAITEILELVFQVLNSSISYSGGDIQIIHDWEMKASRDSDECYLNNIIFEEIYQSANELFFDDTFGVKNLGDVLRKLAIDWGSFTGLISYNKAFFKKLFHYNSSNLQDVIVDNRQKGYKYELIRYIKIDTGISSPNEPYQFGDYTDSQNQTIERKTIPGFFVVSGSSGTNIQAVISRSDTFTFDHNSVISSPPSENDIYSNNGSEFKVIGTTFGYGDTERRITAIRVTGANDPDASGTLTKVSGDGDATYTYASYGDADGTYSIFQIRDPYLYLSGYENEFKDSGDLLGAFWYYWRGNLQSCRVDKLTLRGINYDFLKDFNYNGSKYQPIGMKFNFAENRTECNAIYLGEL